MKKLVTLAFCAALVASPALAQSTTSGSASGAGADQGGSGSPGSGTGTPGAVQAGQTGTGVGTSATSKQTPVVPANGGAAGTAPAQ